MYNILFWRLKLPKIPTKPSSNKVYNLHIIFVKYIYENLLCNIDPFSSNFICTMYNVHSVSLEINEKR